MMVFFKIYKKVDHYTHLFLFLFLLLPFVTKSQSETSSNTLKAYKLLFDLQTDQSDNLLLADDDEPFSWYVQNLTITTKIFIKEDPDEYKSNKSQEAYLLKKISTLDDNDPMKLFLKAEVKLQWALLKMKYEDEFGAFWSLRQAYIAANENLEKFPDHIPSHKTLGVLHSIYGSIPDRYNWLLNIFGIEGDWEKGLEELNLVYQDNGLFSLESGLILALVKSYLLEQSEESERMITEIINTKENNLITSFIYCLITMKNAQSGKALEALRTLKWADYHRLPQLYYTRAEILLQKGDYHRAIDQYNFYFEEKRGKYILKDALFKIGICYWQLGDTARSVQYFNMSRSTLASDSEADVYAKAILETRQFPNRDLIRARYATDGGFFKTADSVLNHMEIRKLNEDELTEYFYRKARLAHRTDDIPRAITFYKETIHYQDNQNLYFAPNSCLQLGKIYLSKNQKDEAVSYLKKVKDYKNYPYQGSIERKAKYSLKEIKND